MESLLERFSHRRFGVFREEAMSSLWSRIRLFGQMFRAAFKGNRQDGKTPVRQLLETHFGPDALDRLAITERRFPFRVRADLQRALDRLFAEPTKTTVSRFCGIHMDSVYENLSFPGMLVQSYHSAVAVPPQYEELDIGDELPCRCLKNGLWLLREGNETYATLMAPVKNYTDTTGILFQVATANTPAGAEIAQRFFRHLEEAVRKAGSYRGKVLSLESKHSYTGELSGIMVHRLRTVTREQVILPRATLDLLERNVIQFVRQRPQLAAFGQPTKKGLLFYGPPGTGKTHTLHYLAQALPEHTTMLITAEQVGLLDEYMSLARLLQPSIVVIEDADLIAKDRTRAVSPCEEALLNRLLNEMDGLKEDAALLFILTTNRPEVLEEALASRPGRIDQAIEFPLPDEEGRAKLVRLYSRGVEIPDDVVADMVRRTERVSAAFIKELMRRAVQYHLESNGKAESNGARTIERADVECALQEMLFKGGSLNLKLLGGQLHGIGFGRSAENLSVTAPGGRMTSREESTAAMRFHDSR
jgi:cell division protease FtsH